MLRGTRIVVLCAVGVVGAASACLPFGELVACDDDEACPEEQRCSPAGFCVDEAADAGALGDGGILDAGLVDGGPVDGGVPDGGPVDGGLVDGGPVDGGVADGGSADDGGSDGDPLDGGEDGGLVDAGSQDAGPPRPGCRFLPSTARPAGDADPPLVEGGRWVCPLPSPGPVDDGRAADAGPFDGSVPEPDAGPPDEGAGIDGRDAGAEPTFPPPEPPPVPVDDTMDGRSCRPPDGGLLVSTDGGELFLRFDGGFSCPPDAD